MSDEKSPVRESAFLSAWKSAVQQYERIVEAELTQIKIGRSALERMAADDGWLRERLRAAILRQFFVLDSSDKIVRLTSDMYGNGRDHKSKIATAFTTATASIENHIIEDVLNITEQEAKEIYREALKELNSKEVKKMYLDSFRWAFSKKLSHEIKSKGKADGELAADNMAKRYRETEGCGPPPTFTEFREALALKKEPQK